jgi:hemerythrin-like domain-containing protein
MEVIDRMVLEHMELRSALNDLVNTSATSTDQRDELLANLMDRLDLHERAEEETVYQALGMDPDVRPLVLEALEEHRVSRLLFTDLSMLDRENENWLPKLIVANNLITLHMDIEEGNVVPLCKQLFSAEKLKELDMAFKDAERKMIQRVIE